MYKKIILAGLGLCGSHFGFYQLTKFDKEIQVVDKQVTNLTFTDEKNINYKCGNLLWDLSFSKCDNWRHLEKDKIFKIKGYGITVKQIGLKPIVTQVDIPKINYSNTNY